MKATKFKYELQKYSPGSKIDCPSCTHRKCFVRFVDCETGELMPDQFGRCERVNNCGYFRYPDSGTETFITKLPVPEIEVQYVPDHIMNATMRKYESNNLFLWLSSKFTKTVAEHLAQKFYIGTAKGNGTIFWHVNKNGYCCNGKKMLYQLDGKRDRNSMPSALYLTGDGYEFPFFGEHQLNNTRKTVAIVESEKTAIIASVFHPEIIWLACGGANGLTHKKTTVLRNRQVILYPDYDKAGRTAFYSKLEYLKSICHVEIADDFPEVWTGEDIADVLLNSTDLSIEPQFGNLIKNEYPVLWDL